MPIQANSAGRRGFTLIECIVVLAIVGLLAALLIPAVQRAREAGRRAACVNNLRQIGLALQSYADLHRVYPMPVGAPKRGDPYFQKQFSALSQLLPFMEQSAVYHSINFDIFVDDYLLFIRPKLVESERMNSTAFNTRIAAFLCPSDPEAGGAPDAPGCSYRVNLGLDDALRLGPRSAAAGPFVMSGVGGPAGIQDGLSATVVLSERLRGSRSRTALDERRDLCFGTAWGEPTAPNHSPCVVDWTQPIRFFADPGMLWAVGGLSQTCYVHDSGPNAPECDCVDGGFNPVVGVVGARSLHFAGVHAARADGSVHFERDTIGPAVWRALGTRSGQEMVEE